MEMIKRIEPFALLVMVLGALNWGIIGITDGDTNVLSKIFGDGTLLNVVYVVVGVIDGRAQHPARLAQRRASHDEIALPRRREEREGDYGEQSEDGGPRHRCGELRGDSATRLGARPSDEYGMPAATMGGNETMSASDRPSLL